MSVLETRSQGLIWVYPVEEPGILIGSDPRAHVSLRHPTVIPFHCGLRKKGGTYILSDLSGGAGTFLNGRRIREGVLRDRDVLQLGSIRLSYADAAILEGPRVFCPGFRRVERAEDLPVAMEVGIETRESLTAPNPHENSWGRSLSGKAHLGVR